MKDGIPRGKFATRFTKTLYPWFQGFFFQGCAFFGGTGSSGTGEETGESPVGNSGTDDSGTDDSGTGAGAGAVCEVGSGGTRPEVSSPAGSGWLTGNDSDDEAEGASSKLGFVSGWE